MDKLALPNLESREYEHPFDRQALDLVKQVPRFDDVARFFWNSDTEKYRRVSYLGSYIRVEKAAFPKLHAQLTESCATLAFNYVPKLYILPESHIKAGIAGVEDPLIIISTGAIESLADDELRFLLGRELASIKSGHLLYQSMASNLSNLIGAMGKNPLFKVAQFLLSDRILEWARYSKLTADRAGLLVAQNFHACITTMMKQAGLPNDDFQRKDLVNGFLLQARDFQNLGLHKQSDKARKKLSENLQTPWTVDRAWQLLVFHENGEYETLMEAHGQRVPVYVDSEDRTCLNITCETKLLRTAKFCPGCGRKIWWTQGADMRVIG